VKTAVKDFQARDRAVTRTLLPIVAIGGGFVVTPAAALELGEATVQSHLGQPLRASIAYALAPNEMLSNTCVSIGGGRSTGGLPGIGTSSIRITERAIVITGESVVREPMLGTRVTINCPYTPNLSREYMLFVDPAVPAPVSGVASAAAPAATVTTAPVAPRAARPAVTAAPVELSTRIQVQPGESLSEIASRIRNCPVGLWPAVNAIFAANPDAFIDNDPNKLKAGSWLSIPSFDGTEPVVVDAAPTSAVPTETTADNVVDTVDGGVYEPPILEEIAEPETAKTTATESTAAESTASGSTNELRPGDVILDSSNPYVAPATAVTETVVIPDTQLPGPETASASPNVPTAIVSTGARSESTSLYTWLIGGGLAIIAVLVLFGRRVRDRFGSTPVGAAASTIPLREGTDTVDAQDNYDIDDDSPTEENLALDADLVLGTGLAEGTDMDVAPDFGFASTTELDIELPFEPEQPVSDNETDVILAPSATRVESILESEVLPEDDDYDMSVIMDATQMPRPEDVTERDLKAVPVGSTDETLISDNYTISKEVDYDILEEDYEEELTATQALNEEISRAAAELSSNLEETVSDDETSALPRATVTELDVTAQLPAHEGETVEMELSRDPNDTAAVTVNLPTDDETAEMPVANDDDTAEMQLEGGKVDTRKG
jgi:hypothetical protein